MTACFPTCDNEYCGNVKRDSLRYEGATITMPAAYFQTVRRQQQQQHTHTYSHSHTEGKRKLSYSGNNCRFWERTRRIFCVKKCYPNRNYENRNKMYFSSP